MDDHLWEANTGEEKSSVKVDIFLFLCIELSIPYVGGGTEKRVFRCETIKEGSVYSTEGSSEECSRAKVAGEG